MTGWNLPPGCTNADIERAMGGDEECYHEDYEIDFEGRFSCKSCSEAHWATEAEIGAYRYDNHDYDKMLRREERRDRRRDLWRRLTFRIRWPLARLTERISPRAARKLFHDDEVPF
jgi:hypothetical protein